MAEIDVNDLTNTGKSEARLKIPEGDLVLAIDKFNEFDYEMHFMITQGIRDRKTLCVNYPMANKKQPAGEVNPTTQQIDFYIRSPQQNPKNKPNREVFMHFFGMEVAWK